MRHLRNWTMKLSVGLALLFAAGAAQADQWGRFYHYPYSYFPQNYRRPFRSQDFDTTYGYPIYPQYMAFPPYFRTDLYYPYLKHRDPGGSKKSHHQGLHYILDVF